jgi:hypothetical protein
MVRVMIEGENEKEINTLATGLADIIKAKLD